MAQAIISRRGRRSGSGSGYVTITFNGVSALKRTGAAALYQPRYGLAATTVGDMLYRDFWRDAFWWLLFQLSRLFP